MTTNFSGKTFVTIFFAIILSGYFLGVYWSFEPEQLDIRAEATKDATAAGIKPVVGYTTTTALIRVTETLLNKPGGYLSNDALPPSVFLDNIPAWELGALEMSRDMALVMRQEFSRSQSQSVENKHLKVAQPQYNIDHKSWAMPSAESEYNKAINELYAYRKALGDVNSQTAQFYARSDNLRDWIQEVNKRLGSYSQRLSASVGREQLNTDLAGDSVAQQSTSAQSSVVLKTSWWKIDNEFYEARGACWALLHFLRAVEIDFNDVLEKKNAKVSVQQIIRELEASQESIWSPMILNGDGFGLLANHSLVMANYISRANAALIDLNDLLSQG
ncbi:MULTISPECIES: DUF2333 family protein [unclassified Colwellia]|jgi:hypothetical protein|uniref:DUF2333 family protein n=1 Tax=unclassified Colwellia TaxID=196834 RepID=UPI0015F4F25E|nr:MULTISPECIES: DUF2333 family protein [unclassified Colwellia]MBA6365393.1 DUF2333 family protein [Colwellia sp. BRX8-8]MBA6337953.1 DUF2333 family protein [Colwellia sp. BRX8-7]MBA6346866.1 DUF2333 family protein [Colwellia sp. BRX8-9]MBA6350514.1 DUF2333 family protein [Colwellia sp. BRX9-1]MBA6355397.1 DUF2333 family protein [Colwellia sp. BRX8-3]|tara:strand:- start:2983 stop:3975 length:993 start_codon:yes stop_codon:yes gene_type:complete